MKHTQQLQIEFAKIALDLKKRSLPKKEDPFTYKTIADEMWRDVWDKAKEHFKTSFDWENNDSTGQARCFTFVRRDPKDDFEWTYKFNCELWIAGGDWESPCYYFKCQLVDGSIYADDYAPELPFPGDIGEYRKSHFILIPPKDGGNSRLVPFTTSKGEKKFGAPDNSSSDEVPELEPRKAWEWVEKYLADFLNEYEKYWQKRQKEKNQS